MTTGLRIRYQLFFPSRFAWKDIFWNFEEGEKREFACTLPTKQHHLVALRGKEYQVRACGVKPANTAKSARIKEYSVQFEIFAEREGKYIGVRKISAEKKNNKKVNNRCKISMHKYK